MRTTKPQLRDPSTTRTISIIQYKTSHAPLEGVPYVVPKVTSNKKKEGMCRIKFHAEIGYYLYQPICLHNHWLLDTHAQASLATATDEKLTCPCYLPNYANFRSA